MYNSTTNVIAQEEKPSLTGDVLRDISSTGRERPWRVKKMANELLAMAYDFVNPDKAVRLRECGTFLLFRQDSQGNRRLESMSSCRVRLCPLCSWRRSLKVYANTMAIVNEVQKRKLCAYIFLTLTVRNVSGDQLSGAIDQLLKGFDRLLKRAPVKAAVRGMYRGLEVTHNTNRDSKDYDTYHPHLHCLLAVAPSYFMSRYYLSQAKWTQIWKECLRVKYDPVIDVRRVKGDTAAAVAEAAKYSVKESDFILPEDWDLTVDAVSVLDSALDRRRLVAYTGIFRDVQRDLALEDEEVGDLVHVDGDDDVSEDGSHLVLYRWYTGYRQYISET